MYSNAAKTINLHNILDLQVKNVDETTDLINLVVVRKMNALIQTIAIKGSHKKRENMRTSDLKEGGCQFENLIIEKLKIRTFSS